LACRLRHARDLEHRITHAPVNLPACPDSAVAAYALVGARRRRAAWFTAVESHPDTELLRADGRESMLAIAYTLGWAADAATMTTRPTLARCMEVSGKCRRTVQNWWRWLEARGFLLVLEEGTTPQYRPAILRRGAESNLAREWRLVVPSVEASCTPGLVSGSSPPRTREAHPDKARGFAADSPASPPRRLAQARQWPPGQNPQRRAERLAAADQLRAVHPVLRRISARMLRSLLRPWFAAGYSPADVLVSMESRPSGEPHEHSDRVRHPALWLAARLSCWLGENGPVPPRSQRLAGERERARAQQSTARAERQRRAESAAAVDVTRRAAELRAIIAKLPRRPG
jgi:hypothetical protein